MTETIVINRRQSYTQSPSAYMRVYTDGEPIDRRTSLQAQSDQPILKIIYQNNPEAGKNWEQKINEFKYIKNGWNGYEAPSPSQTAIITANSIVGYLLSDDLEPKRVKPSVIGGVGITHRNNDRKVYIEIYNNGKVYALFSDGVTEPEAVEVPTAHRSLKSFVTRMREYLDV
jgi:hypothetical protein